MSAHTRWSNRYGDALLRRFPAQIAAIDKCPRERVYFHDERIGQAVSDVLVCGGSERQIARLRRACYVNEAQLVDVVRVTDIKIGTAVASRKDQRILAVQRGIEFQNEYVGHPAAVVGASRVTGHRKIRRRGDSLEGR